MSKIAITDYFPAPSEEEIAILGDLVGNEIGEDTEVLLVWHADINEEFVRRTPNLRGVQRYGVGFDTLDLAYLKSRGIPACNNPDYGIDEVSDTAIAFIMAISRGICLYDCSSRKLHDSWQENVCTPIRRSKEMKVGVIGAGRIGSSVLLKSRAIGFQTMFYDPYKESGYEKVLKAERATSLDELLEKSDIISIHCPLNAETKGLINKDFIGKMKTGASLVNTARGGMLENTDLLLDALRSEKLSSVALDVLPFEPPKADNFITTWREQPDWLQGRLIINPHSSYYSQEALIDLRRNAAINALKLFNGQPVMNLL